MTSIIASLFSPRKIPDTHDKFPSPLGIKSALAAKKLKRKSLPNHSTAKSDIVTEGMLATPSRSPPKGKSPRKSPSRGSDGGEVDRDQPTSAKPEVEEASMMPEEAEFAFDSFVDHRWEGETMQIQVQWEDGDITWEDELTLHQDAREALLEYWKSVGGRPPNPRHPDLFNIYAIQKHSKDRSKLLVEWVGFGPKDASWLSRTVVEETAPDLAARYWASVKPGRPKRRRPRGRQA